MRGLSRARTVGFALAALALGASGARGAEAASGWAAIDHWPDFMGGIWGTGPGAGGPDDSRYPAPKVKPDIYAADMAKLHASSEAFGSASCEPHGIPVDVGGQFYFSRGTIFLLADVDYAVIRQIHLDRSSHGDPDLTYYGDSIGHWEGDTLVVDTVGFLPQVPIEQGVPGNGQTHVIERFRMSDANTMQLQLTVINPQVLSEPWTTTRVLKRHREWEIHETYCTQNNRDAPDVNGQPHLDLTPPK